ncbi:BamA/TamA family outer membrane protein [Cecembia rubra]|uniref:Surface antigen-like protein n=1 Tax=Cecembia rubra TaxID=1485585 RepID=A0A2P8DYP7_9BACT|nr:BamA/TamA family outer membrane protein [Cecembia rubra]PSL02332.1 surface antigen-like protein [Cecembia rubra]
MRIKKYIGLFFPLLIFSCSVKKFIPEGEQLYTGSTIQLESDLSKKESEEIQTDLEKLLRPLPNSKLLGMRFGLWAYYKGQKEKPGFINKFLSKKFGEKPVYLGQIQPERTSNILLNRLENKGFYFSSSIYQITEKGKFANLEYQVRISDPYILETYQILGGDSLPINQEIQMLMGRTIMKKGSRLDLDELKKERERIDRDLKARGYYNFNPDLLIFEADTNHYEDRKFDLYLRLKSNTPIKATFPYSIEHIYVFPDYNVHLDNGDGDTVSVSGIEFIQKPEIFKPELLQKYILFREGSKFNPEISRTTSNRLSNIGNFRYVNISYDVSDTVLREDGTYPLKANIYLSPLNKRSVRAEIQGLTKSNSFVGPALLLGYQNRNLFRGGEIFNLTGKFGYEVQLASGDREALQSIEMGLTGSLVFPRVLFPVPVMNRFRYSIPKTRISAGYEYQNRTDLYLLYSYNTSFGYFWNVNRFVYHEFNPISLSIVNLARTSPRFEEILNANPFLRRSFEQQFISGMNYTFNYNQLADPDRKNAIFIGATVDFAGNLFRGLNALIGSENPGSIFGLEFAQYLKGDIDLRYYKKFSAENVLVSRIFAGLGVPVGNSLSLPFVKQYFAGGPRSVRAFRIRALGPGTFMPQDTNMGGFFDQAGDIRLEGNLEYRFPFNKYLKGAFFVDAGNVWLYKENDALPGGKFTNSWAEELAVGGGFGLRLDIQLFVIRLDTAIPLRRPWLLETGPWQDRIWLGNRDWRRDNLVFNFAIGYPF